MLPRIGLTTSVVTGPTGTPRVFLNAPYVTAIETAGGVPVLVTPSHTGNSRRALYELLDGLCLTGGEDVAPERYGEMAVHPTVEVVLERDALEFELLQWALADGLPVLAICRGVQVLNVALGGTLYQDLPTDRPGALGHDQARTEPPRSRPEPHHAVSVVAGSRLAELVGAIELAVNSLHHQGIRRLAPGLVAVARAPDGLIEGVESADPGCALVGVQWHPEELLRRGDAASHRLFDRFVAATIASRV